jgi:hypothetical protein
VALAPNFVNEGNHPQIVAHDVMVAALGKVAEFRDTEMDERLKRSIR